MTTYRESGVDILKGDRLVELIKPMARACPRKGVAAGIGGFSGLFSVSGEYRKPVLAASTDGVGTKLKIAFALSKHDTVGIDLVAMVVNDILCAGAEPIFFLDYFATGRLDLRTATHVISGIARGCRLAGCALIGGETAEMPGMYAPGEYDLAGFGVGVVEEDRIVDGSRIREGDYVVGIASSGFHSNGYSLVRKVVLDQMGLSLRKFVRKLGDTIGNVLLAPTVIYVKPVLGLLRKFDVRGLAHITGGGLPGNLPRQLPRFLAARVKQGSWEIPPLFDFIAERGGIPQDEMFKTFNMGIGFALIVPSSQAAAVLGHLSRRGLRAWIIGEVVRRKKGASDFVMQ